MKFNKKNFTIGLLSFVILNAYWACKKDNNSTATPPPAVPANTVQLSTNASFGSIMTDSAGNSLYFFSLDAEDKSACTGGCLTAWPVFYTPTPTLTKGLEATDFSVITRADGAKQTTYKGWPLYYFQNDLKSGDVNGDAVGTVWYVAKPDYSVMLVNNQLLGLDGIEYNSDLQPGDGVTQYITDDRGRTLYAFSPDKARLNTFTKPDLSNNPVWPMDTLRTVGSIPSTLDKTQFDTIMIYGNIQLVYKGWPMYHFSKDSSERGNNHGVSVPHPGVWPVVNKNSAEAPAQ